MSYEKQQWATGDIITAGKLNAMDDEIERLGSETSGGVFVVTVTRHLNSSFQVESVESDKTFDDIMLAYTSKVPIFIHSIWTALNTTSDEGVDILHVEGANDSAITTNFVALRGSLDVLNAYCYTFNADNTINYFGKSYNLSIQGS